MYAAVMYTFTNANWSEDASERTRKRLQLMNDAALEKFLHAAEYMASPQSTWNGMPRQAYTIQLELALEELQRRQLQTR